MIGWFRIVWSVCVVCVCGRWFGWLGVVVLNWGGWLIGCGIGVGCRLVLCSVVLFGC